MSKGWDKSELFLSSNTKTVLPSGFHLPKWIGLFEENNPTARIFVIPAMCNGPVLAATNTSLAAINAMSSSKVI